MTAKKVGACIIAGCPNPAANKIDLRIRSGDRAARWVRSTGALICDQHADNGLHITIALAPLTTSSRSIKTVGLSGVHNLAAAPRTVYRDTDGTIITGDFT